MMIVTLDLQPSLALTDEQLAQICQRNPDWKFERTATGELVVMALTGGETGRRNTKLTARLENWNEATGLGVVFDSSTGFRLPNGAIRSPDDAWISNSRWRSLTPEARQGWIPLCPDFAVELRSPSDELTDLQDKMQEYLANGLRLGWLLDPQTQTVGIYRPEQTVETLVRPSVLAGEIVLSGLTLQLNGILN